MADLKASLAPRGEGPDTPRRAGDDDRTRNPAVKPPPGELVTAVSLPSVPRVSVPSVSVPSALPVTGNGVLVQALVALAALAVGGALLVVKRLRLQGA